jgi:copper resistance protein C
MSKMKSKLLAAVMALALIAPAAALAHPQVITRSPEAGSKLKASPKQIVVSFSEALEIPLCNAKIVGPDGKPVPIGSLATDKDSLSLIIPIKAKLKPGIYTVSWEIVTEDHDVPGRYRFEVVR